MGLYLPAGVRLRPDSLGPFTVNEAFGRPTQPWYLAAHHQFRLAGELNILTGIMELAWSSDFIDTRVVFWPRIDTLLRTLELLPMPPTFIDVGTLRPPAYVTFDLVERFFTPVPERDRPSPLVLEAAPRRRILLDPS